MDYILTFCLYTALIVCVPYLIGYANKHKKTETITLVTASIICGLVAAFRGTTGTDSSMYIDAYRYGTSTISRWAEFEPGFVYMVMFLNLLRMPYQVMFFIMAFIPAFCVFKAVMAERKYINVKVAAFIYISDLFFFGLNGMRQHFAICVCLYAFVLYFRDKKIYSLILIIIACLFHRSALMCFAVIGAHLFYKSKHKKIILTVVIGVALVLVSNRQLLGRIITTITRRSYYGGYVTRDAETDTNIFKYYLKNIVLILIPALQMKFIKKDNTYFLYLLLMLVGIILSSLGAVTATQVSRLGMYFSYMKIFICAYCATKPIRLRFNNVNSVRVNRYLIYSYFTFMFYYSYFVKGFSLVVPYAQQL